VFRRSDIVATKRPTQSLISDPPLETNSRVPGARPERQTDQSLDGIVDRAMQQEAKGRAAVPAEWQPDFDAVLEAFSLVEQGQDEAARAKLQTVGLRSPFLEWKLFLRGLIAFFQKDDTRALENWQRLKADRLPARLAAPYRLVIDESYRLAQAPPSQMALQKLADQLLGGGIVPQLRTVQKALATEGNYRTALRQIESLLPVLRQSYPQLLPRLAAAFYWELIVQGEPDDVQRYQRVFGAPHDDPRFHRVRGLVLEKNQDYPHAQQAWTEYEKSIIEDPSNWPGEQAVRARALVWLHMARNAMTAETAADDDELPPWERRQRRPRAVKPGVEECLTKSLELAPDLLEAHRSRVHYHIEHDRFGKARQAAQRLLAQFPNELETLRELALLEAHRGDHVAEVKLLQRAVHVSPLDRRLRNRLSVAHLFAARNHAEAKRFDQARADYKACLAVGDGNNPMALCKWAACEFKAGDDARADELISQARGQAGTQLAVAFSMLIEVIRLKLPKSLKTRFDAEFKETLAEPPTVDGVLAAAESAATHQSANINYPGKKAHEKQVLSYIDRARKLNFTEAQLEKLCGSLSVMKGSRVFRYFIRLAQERFIENPSFCLCEAQYLTKQPGRLRNIWSIRLLLQRALELARRRPPDEKQKEMIELVREMIESINQYDPFGALMPGGGPDFMGGFFGPFDPEDDEDGF
jgi:tetratricopeptide (TPR) repeat protein